MSSVILQLMKPVLSVKWKHNALRAQSASQFGMDYNNVIRVEGETKFEGYTESESLAKVTALFHDGKSVDNITAGQSAVVILENTPFYAESGGQIRDSGYLISQGIQLM